MEINSSSDLDPSNLEERKLVQPESSAPDRDSCYGWVVTCVGWLATFLMLGWTNSFGVYLDAIAKDLDSDIGPVVLSQAVANLLNPLVGLIAGPLTDLYGCRPLYFVAAVAFFGSSYATSWVTAVWQLNILFGVTAGLGGGCVLSPSLSVVAGWFDDYTGIAMGLLYSGSSLGSAILPTLAGQFLDSIGWRASFKYCSFCTVTLVICAVLTKPRVRHGGGDVRAGFSGIGSVIVNPCFGFLWGMAFCQAWGFFNCIAFLPKYGQEAIGMHIAEASNLLFAYSIACAVGSIVSGLLLNKLGADAVIIGAYAICGVSGLFWPHTTLAWQCTMFAIIAGVAAGAFLAALPIIITRRYPPQKAGSAIACVMTGWGAGSFVGPIAVSALKKGFDSYAVAFATIPVMFVVGTLVWLVMVGFTPRRGYMSISMAEIP